MAKSSARSTGDILHAAAVRLRVTGSGNLQSYLRSLDGINNVQLADIPMRSTTNKEPTILANFNESGIQYELTTTEINETFTIDKIVVFVRPISTGYPIV